MAEHACPKCREKIKVGAEICRFCGHKLSVDEQERAANGAIFEGVAKVGLSLLFLVLLLGWCSSQSDPLSSNPDAQTASLDSAEMARRLTACEDVLDKAKESGLLVRTEDGQPLADYPSVTLIVDDRLWNTVDWDLKKAMMVAGACVRDKGGPYENVIVSAEGRRSGRKLAGGLPGKGTLAPE